MIAHLIGNPHFHFIQHDVTNFIYVDPENDIVAVLRWIDRPAIDGFVQRLLAALAR